MLLALCLCHPVWAGPKAFVGKAAPFFCIESGSGKVLDARMIKGKVVVLFYECKEILPQSRPLKDKLIGFFHEQPREIHDLILVLPVINATSAVWPFKGAWKKALAENSQRIGMTVYGDWDGKMGAAYGVKGDDTNLIIVDKKGVIRFFQSGPISPEKAGTIIALLQQIANEPHGQKKSKSI
jgi:hypothetical protein